MEYRDVMLYYHPDIDIRLFDHHFSDVFDYAKLEGEELPIIEAKDFSRGEQRG